MNKCVWSHSSHFIAQQKTSLQKNEKPNPCQIQRWQCVSARVPYWMLAAAAAHCLSFTCGKLIATSIMLLNEFVYPAQFTKMMGEMLQPLSSKLITLSLDNTTEQWWICLSEKGRQIMLSVVWLTISQTDHYALITASSAQWGGELWQPCTMHSNRNVFRAATNGYFQCWLLCRLFSWLND